MEHIDHSSSESPNSKQKESSDQETMLEILKFMQQTDCETYEQAKQYLQQAEFNQNENSSISSSSQVNLNKSGIRNTANTNISNEISFASSYSQQEPQPISHRNNFISLSPEEAVIFQQRLRDAKKKNGLYGDGEGQELLMLMRGMQSQQELRGRCCLYRVCRSTCATSFKCFKHVKNALKRKFNNTFKSSQNKVLYFSDLYQEQFENIQQFQDFQQDCIIESYELNAVEENHKAQSISASSEGSVKLKPIFCIVSSNHKMTSVQKLLSDKNIMEFILLLVTLSQIKKLGLEQRHILRRSIQRCPTVFVYMKNYYKLEDVLLKAEGEEQIKHVSVPLLQNILSEVPGLCSKWRHLLSLEKAARQNVPLDQLATFYGRQDNAGNIDEDDYDEQGLEYQSEGSYQDTDTQRKVLGQQDKSAHKSLIQEQTLIYEQMAAQESHRKQSIDLQQRHKEQLRQQRQVRRMSLPDQPQPLAQSQHSNHDVIQFRFRSPVSGQYIYRRFLSDQKVDILYQYVDTNEQIDFQTDPDQRNFELFTSYPPTPLSDKKEQLLKDVFDQIKENILIREI